MSNVHALYIRVIYMCIQVHVHGIDMYIDVYRCIYLLKKKTGDREEAAQKGLLQREAETRRRRKADWA